MVKAALDYIKILEACGFYDIVVSLKASNILDTVEAYRKMANVCSYPFHLGVTATGLPTAGIIKSSIAIGALLLDGIGDTIRVSLTAGPEEEVRVAKSILEALSLRKFGPEVISCPTCGRCEVDLIKIVKNLEAKLSAIPARPCPSGRRAAGGRYPCLSGRQALSALPSKVAVMGCVVNGPGEAKEADIGIAFGSKDGLLFKKGRPVKKISFNRCLSALWQEIRKD
jgi:(E)-4-hydroxy-3-methylbut-2-enyl-diphosphate synthase